MLVLRQKRILPSAAGTCMAKLQQLTMKMFPVRAFSGCEPSGLNERLSRQVPVHSELGSIFAFACVSL